MAKHGSRRRAGRSRRGYVVECSDGEQTAVGTERAEDLPDDPVIVLSEVRQRHHVQNRTLLGLLVLLVEVLVLGVLAMVGVALDWFDASFAVQVLAITVTPSFTAWLLVVRWAFRRAGRAG